MKRLATMPLLLIVVSTLLLMACSSEKAEAVRFGKVLKQQQSSLSNANSQERQLLTSLGRWAGQVAFLGGSGESSNQQARQYSQQVKSLQSQVAQIRQAVEAESLNQAFNQNLRSNIISSLTRREQFLGEVSSLCDNSTGFGTTFGTQFQVPRAVGQIVTKLQSATPPEDNIGTALSELRTKYEITDAELAK